jgi:hypothetical protein
MPPDGQGIPDGGNAWMDVRERILVEVLTNGATEQAEIQKQFGSCDISEHVQWLVDAALLERSGSSEVLPVIAEAQRRRSPSQC